MALETDPHRLEQRQKQIDFGLATTGYCNYVSWLKNSKGKVKPIPIPNIYVQCSKRSWDGQIRHWRRLLHLWDEVAQPTGTPGDKHFQDPCANVAEYSEDMDYSERWQANWARPQQQSSTRMTFAPSYADYSETWPANWERPHQQSSTRMTYEPSYPEMSHSNWRSQQQSSTRMASPTPLSSFSFEPSYVDPRLIRRSYSDDFTATHMPANHLARPQSYIPQMPMHYQAQQQPYQLPNQMMPVAQHMGYMYPAMPPPGWQISVLPTGYAQVMPTYAPTLEQGLVIDQGMCAMVSLLSEQEVMRSSILEAESAERQALLRKQLIAAVTAASAAHKELARQPPAAWNERSIGMLLSEEFGSGASAEQESQNELLPPSLMERCNPTSPTAGSDSGCDFRLDEERHRIFRLHFGEAGSAAGLGSLESPPPCWSPARLTPGVTNRRGVLSASPPGLTPSPNEWQRSPAQVSPRAALAFADWSSPQPVQPQEATKEMTAPPEPSQWAGTSSS